MSTDKMGGWPTRTRDALYDFKPVANASAGDDAGWAEVIRKMTKLGLEKTRKRLFKE